MEAQKTVKHAGLKAQRGRLHGVSSLGGCSLSAQREDLYEG
jgi:hypothetical protein